MNTSKFGEIVVCETESRVYFDITEYFNFELWGSEQFKQVKR